MKPCGKYVLTVLIIKYKIYFMFLFMVYTNHENIVLRIQRKFPDLWCMYLYGVIYYLFLFLQHVHTCMYMCVCTCVHMSVFANSALLGSGVRVRVWIRELRKIKRYC